MSSPTLERPTGIRWIVFALSVITSWLLYLHRYAFAFLKPIVAEEWGLDNTELGKIDSAFAFDLPAVSAWWIDAFDVETGRSRLISRRAARTLAGRAAEWQSEVERTAKDLNMDVLRLGIDEAKSDIALMEFVIERRLRKG